MSFPVLTAPLHRPSVNPFSGTWLLAARTWEEPGDDNIKAIYHPKRLGSVTILADPAS